jgi:hypothetical protein
MGANEIVHEVSRVQAVRDEVIDIRVRLYFSVAVKAGGTLQTKQAFPYSCERLT